MNIKKWALDANERIAGHIRRTPLEYSPYLSELTRGKIYLKLENYQLTGSFKVRGALNKVLSLPQDELSKGVITASTGNHAAAVAYATKIANSRAKIFMPETVSEVKVNNLKYFKNVEIVYAGEDSVESELKAIEVAQNEGLTYISPYNDEEVIGGQGTIGIEIQADLPDVDAVLIPVGGGGMIAGIGGYLKQNMPEVEIVGCQPENSAVMYHSVQAGRVLEMESMPTISDGTAGGMEVNSITFPICQQYVGDFHLVSEGEILSALKILLEKHYMLVEGSAGLSVASLLKNKDKYRGKNVVLILCGNKMSSRLLEQVLHSS